MDVKGLSNWRQFQPEIIVMNVRWSLRYSLIPAYSIAFQEEQKNRLIPDSLKSLRHNHIIPADRRRLCSRGRSAAGALRQAKNHAGHHILPAPAGHTRSNWGKIDNGNQTVEKLLFDRPAPMP